MIYKIDLIVKYEVEADNKEEAEQLALNNIYTSHITDCVELIDVDIDECYEVN